MKIGIMTYWNSKDNYGQLLQCYAMQKYLRQLGHEPYLIRYDFSGNAVKRPLVGWIKKIYKLAVPSILLRNLEWRIHPRKFEKFREKHIVQSARIYHSHEDLRSNAPQAEMYIAGSDQIWHFDEKANVKDRIHAFLLDFGDTETIRVAGAASWGIETLTENLVQEISPLIAKFNYVTVREQSGVKLCKICGVDADIVYDPTMHLSAEDYRDLYKNSKIRKPLKKYILIYLINNGGQLPDLKTIYKWARARQMSVELITANGVLDLHHKTYATVEEWLYLMDHAEYVITNSYHGCVFGCLFQKRFAVIKLNGKNQTMNTRLETLFQLYNMKPVYLKSVNDIFAIDEVKSDGKGEIEVQEKYMLHMYVKELLV